MFEHHVGLQNGRHVVQRPLLLKWINFDISNYSHYKVWDEIIYPFPNFNSAIVETWDG